jgi:hypothetical protein
MPDPIDNLNAHVSHLAQLQGTGVAIGASRRFTPASASKWATLYKNIHAHLHPPFVDPPPPPPPPPPAPTLDKLELDTGSIAFGNGAPVGGSAHLSLFPNGAYSFSGHFHDSGATSYDTEFVWVLKSNTGTVFTFVHRGRVHGTFEAGSRNDDWGESGSSAPLGAAWGDVSAGYQLQWTAGVNLDLGKLLDDAIKAVGQAATVIAIVA